MNCYTRFNTHRRSRRLRLGRIEVQIGVPTEVKDHEYCVTNRRAATARTSTLALTEVTLPYIEALASKGIAGALRDDPGLRDGLNLHAGHVTCRPLADDLGLDWTAPDELGF
jgi:alanine dehydrogenase